MNRRGFTLIELIGVVSIIAILLTISVPAFTSLLESNAVSQADSQLRLGAREARDAAVRSFDGDTALVFFYEPGGQVTAAIVKEVGVLTVNGFGIDVFAADGVLQPRQLAQGLVVRGLALPTSDFDASNNDSSDAFDGVAAWYNENRYDEGEANWLLPETGFYDPDDERQGTKRNTFAFRFEQGTGRLVLDNRPMLIVDPSPSQAFRTSGLQQQYDPTRRVDLTLWASAILSEPDANDRNELLGDEATDTVLAFPIAQIALYRPQEAARQLRAAGISGSDISTALDESGEFYRFTRSGSFAFDQDPAIAEALRERLSEVAEIYSINRTTGEFVVLNIEEGNP